MKITREQILFTISILKAFSKIAMQQNVTSRGQARSEAEFAKETIVALDEMIEDAS